MTKKSLGTFLPLVENYTKWTIKSIITPLGNRIRLIISKIYFLHTKVLSA